MTAAETRARLIEATAKLLDTTPPEQITTRAVLDASGISHGSLYHQFNDLQELIDAALLHRLNAVRAADLQEFRALFAAITTTSGIQQVIRDAHRLFLSPVRVQFRMERARLIGRAIGNPALGAAVAADEKAITDAWVEAITDWQAKGLVDPSVDPAALSVFIQAYVFGKLLDDIQPQPVDPEAWISLLDRILSGLLVPK